MTSYQNMKESLKDYIRLLSINYVEFIKKSNQVTFMSGFTKKLGRNFVKSHELFINLLILNQKVEKLS